MQPLTQYTSTVTLNGQPAADSSFLYRATGVEDLMEQVESTLKCRLHPLKDGEMSDSFLRTLNNTILLRNENTESVLWFQIEREDLSPILKVYQVQANSQSFNVLADCLAQAVASINAVLGVDLMPVSNEDEWDVTIKPPHPGANSVRYDFSPKVVEREPNTANLDLAYTAMCVWEYVLEVEKQTEKELSPSEVSFRRHCVELRKEIGASQLRDIALKWATHFRAAWGTKLAEWEAEDRSIHNRANDYDWQFIPKVLCWVARNGLLEEDAIGYETIIRATEELWPSTVEYTVRVEFTKDRTVEGVQSLLQAVLGQQDSFVELRGVEPS